MRQVCYAAQDTRMQGVGCVVCVQRLVTRPDVLIAGKPMCGLARCLCRAFGGCRGSGEPVLSAVRL